MTEPQRNPTSGRIHPAPASRRRGHRLLGSSRASQQTGGGGMTSKLDPFPKVVWSNKQAWSLLVAPAGQTLRAVRQGRHLLRPGRRVCHTH